MVSQSIVGRVSSSLVIRNVNYSHAGLYECMAVNSLGSNLAPAIVTVYGEVYSVVLMEVVKFMYVSFLVI